MLITRIISILPLHMKAKNEGREDRKITSREQNGGEGGEHCFPSSRLLSYLIPSTRFPLLNRHETPRVPQVPGHAHLPGLGIGLGIGVGVRKRSLRLPAATLGPWGWACPVIKVSEWLPCL